MNKNQLIAKAMQVEAVLEFNYVDRNGERTTRIALPINMVEDEIAAIDLVRVSAEKAESTGRMRHFKIERMTKVAVYPGNVLFADLVDTAMKKAAGILRALKAARTHSAEVAARPTTTITKEFSVKLR